MSNFGRRKFVLLDSEGRPRQFYDEEINGTREKLAHASDPTPGMPLPALVPVPDAQNIIPDGAAEVSDEHYRELIENPGRRRMCARRKRPVACAPPPPPPATAADIRGELVRRIQRAQAEALADGVPVEDRAAALRAAAARLAAQDPIPADYFDDKHWREAPADG